jgi:hypothetical protein
VDLVRAGALAAHDGAGVRRLDDPQVVSVGLDDRAEGDGARCGRALDDVEAVHRRARRQADLRPGEDRGRSLLRFAAELLGAERRGAQRVGDLFRGAERLRPFDESTGGGRE